MNNGSPDKPELAAAASVAMERRTNEPQHVIVHTRSGWFTRTATWLGWSLFFLTAISLAGFMAQRDEYYSSSKGVIERFHSLEEYGRDKIAIIEVDGMIASGEGFVKNQIDRVREDNKVRGVVLRIDSPGGTVTGSDYILHHLKELKKEKEAGSKEDFPIVVSMGSMAASGGYWIAMAVGDQEKAIYAEPMTITGSIGVIIPHYDLSGLLEHHKVVDDSFAAGERKQLLSMTRPIPAEHRPLIQSYVDAMHVSFKNVIMSGRPAMKADPAKLDQLATGEIFLAEDAKKLGLVDEIGFIEDAIERVLELTGLEADESRVVRYGRKSSPLSELAGLAKSSQASGIDSLLEGAVPRAYAIFTSAPVLAASGKSAQ